MRIVYFLGALGFGLFAAGHYAARNVRPQPQERRKSRRQPRQRARRAIGPTLDLNQASREELQGLGLADYYDRIIDERPFHNKIDLLERMIVPDDLYREIKDRITVRHAA